MPKKRQRTMFKFIVFFCSFGFFFSILTLPASAADRVFYFETPLDTFDRPDLNPQFDITRVAVGLYNNDLDQVHFWIHFKNPLISNQFNDGRGSYAAILIDTNGDDKEDLFIETNPFSYTARIGQPAYASKNCSAVSWMNMEAGVDNRSLGFKVSQKCLGLPNKFRVMGYSDYIEADDISFDFAPSNFSSIDLDDFYNPKPKISIALPRITSDSGKNLENYSRPPDNLSSLVSTLKQSVVTIECKFGGKGGTGSGWAARVSLPVGSPYRSYIITNYHVISDCIFSGRVDIVLANGSRTAGYLAAWDPENDLAGIYIDSTLTPLTWRGPTPVQGGWVGVIGSPLGLPSILTTGIVSSVNDRESLITFTAPINPGNSGGPVFDSIGRVIAIATAKIRDSEGFGIGNGSPLICKVILVCDGNRAWTGISRVESATNTNSTTNQSFIDFRLKLDTKINKNTVTLRGTADPNDGYVVIYMKRVGETKWIRQPQSFIVSATGKFKGSIPKPRYSSVFRVSQNLSTKWSNITIVALR